MSELDYSGLGLKVGIEIHQQLNTKHKLFCQCPTSTSQDPPDFKFTRQLRPSQSELGEVDPAALLEFKKGKNIVYESSSEWACLVEMDEEPPHDLNSEAIDTVLRVALMIKAQPVDEIHVMRKIVVDGSNTGGFQRTCILALGGAVNVDDKIIPIQTICLEEDAARKIIEDEATVTYRLDRLSIPLIEIATAPAINSPQEAEKVALALGRILRSTRKVKRGIGTIRQDLNISLPNGALVEVKGVQKLEQIAKVVEGEVRRQQALIVITQELRKRSSASTDIPLRFIDVTDVFKATESKILRRGLEQGHMVVAVKLPGFGGLLKRELGPNLRLGTEMADRARFWGGVGGIFHTDEMPSYGITLPEVEALRRSLDLTPEDAGVFVCDSKMKAESALTAVVERAVEALRGVPAETRGANIDGTTRYMRPRPGAARMYPETDIPCIPITSSRLQPLKETLPPLPEEEEARLISQYGINRKLAQQLLDSDYLPLFERTVAETNLASSFLATALTETLKSLERDDVPVSDLSDEVLLAMFRLISRGGMAKEVFPEVTLYVAKNGTTPEEALQKLGIKMLTKEEIISVVEKRINEKRALLGDNPDRAFGEIMKLVMADIRGRADAKIVSEIIRKKLSGVNLP